MRGTAAKRSMDLTAARHERRVRAEVHKILTLTLTLTLNLTLALTLTLARCTSSISRSRG